VNFNYEFSAMRACQVKNGAPCVKEYSRVASVVLAVRAIRSRSTRTATAFFRIRGHRGRAARKGVKVLGRRVPVARKPRQKSLPRTADPRASEQGTFVSRWSPGPIGLKTFGPLPRQQKRLTYARPSRIGNDHKMRHLSAGRT